MYDANKLWLNHLHWIMKTESLIIILLISVSCLKLCFSSGFGKCPKHEYMKNFNIDKVDFFKKVSYSESIYILFVSS